MDGWRESLVSTQCLPFALAPAGAGGDGAHIFFRSWGLKRVHKGCTVARFMRVPRLRNPGDSESL